MVAASASDARLGGIGSVPPAPTFLSGGMLESPVGLGTKEEGFWFHPPATNPNSAKDLRRVRAVSQRQRKDKAAAPRSKRLSEPGSGTTIINPFRRARF